MQNSRPNTQKTRVLQYMVDVGPITPLDALTMFGCFRLASIIHVLHKHKYNIETTMKEDGEKRWAEYRYLGMLHTN